MGGAAAVVVLIAAGASPAAASVGVNWTGYLRGAKHSSFSPQTVITPANAGSLVKRWTFIPQAGPAGAPGKQFTASPTVSNGHVYIGANTGDFYALDLRTGQTLWKQFLGFQPKLTCNKRGITSTATVAKDPATGKQTVYVAGGDGYLYALNAATGSVVWKSLVGPTPPSTTVNDVYNWASPIVFGGNVYMGISSNCDDPWVRGGLEKYSQATGAPEGTWWAVADGQVGGGVWTSPAAWGKTIYVSTASAQSKTPGDTFSIVSIDSTTMTKKQAWQVPIADRVVDSDWGSTPTVFRASIGGKGLRMVAACNKNGYLYAFQTNHIDVGPLWQTSISAPNPDGNHSCLPAAIYDGTHLFAAGPFTTIGTNTYDGGVRELDPASGTPLWQTGLPASPIGTPSMDAAGVIAVATWDATPGVTNGTFLLDASTGDILTEIVSPNASYQFSQPVFAGGYLLLGTLSDGLEAYSP
jgi:outer membrane protein assembly factor BamB